MSDEYLKRHIRRSDASVELLNILKKYTDREFPREYQAVLYRQTGGNPKMFAEIAKLESLIYSPSLSVTLDVLSLQEFVTVFDYIVEFAHRIGLPEAGRLGDFLTIDDDASDRLSVGKVNAFLHFYRSRKKLVVIKVNHETNESIITEYDASNNISDKGPEGKTTTPYPRDKGIQPKNYLPQNFPRGKWKIYDKRKGINKWEGDYVLRTNAYQTVNVFRKEYNKEKKKEEWVSDGTQEDCGYNIHAGDYTWESVTDGCIKVSKETIKVLWDLYDEVGVGKNGKVMYLKVKN